MPEFDVEGARKAGYSDDEILSHLTQTRKFDVGGAVNAGYSKPDIINHLASTPPPAAPPEDKGFFRTLFDDISASPKKLADFISGHPLDDVKDAIRESAAARAQHLKRAGDAYQQGDYQNAINQAFFGSVPFLGPALGAAADEWQGGQKGQAGAHALEILGPLLLDPAIQGGEAALASRAGTAVKGGLEGGARSAVGVTQVPLRYRGIGIEGKTLPVPNVLAGATAGGTLAGAAGLPRTAGAIAGGVSPIISGIVRGARDALAERAMLERIGMPRVPPPIWEGAAAAAPAAAPAAVEPIPSDLPSGRTAGGIANQVIPTPVERPGPLWQGPVTPAELRVPTAVEPIPSDLPSGRTIPSAAERAARASQPSAVEPAPAPIHDPQILEDIAQSLAGKSFKRMTVEEQAGVRQIADRLARPTLPEAPQIPPQSVGRIDIGPPSPEAPPLSQQVDAELASRRAAGIQPAQPFPGNVVLGPGRPAAASEAPTPPQPPTAAPEAPIAAGPRTAEEATAFNRTNKAARFADALQKSGITANALKDIEPGYVSQSQIAQGMAPRWGNIAEFLGENEPSADTIAEITRQMKGGKGKAALENAVAKAKETAAATKAKLAPQPAEPATEAEPPAITPGQSVIFPGEQPAVLRNPEAAGYAAQIAQSLQETPEPVTSPGKTVLENVVAKKKAAVSASKAKLSPQPTAPAPAPEPVAAPATAPEAAPEASAAKEPWQMPRDQYENAKFATGFALSKIPEVNAYNEMFRATSDPVFGKNAAKALPELLDKAKAALDERFGPGSGDKYFDSHQAQVAKALSEGKPVPPEVLADYPELQGKPPATASEAAPETPTTPAPPEAAASPNALQQASIKNKEAIAARKAKLTARAVKPSAAEVPPTPEVPPVETKADTVEFGKETTRNGRREFTAQGVMADGSLSGDSVNVRQGSNGYSVERSFYETPPGPRNKYPVEKKQIIGDIAYTKAEARQVAEAYLKGEPHPFAGIEEGLPISEHTPGKGQIKFEPGPMARDGFAHNQADGADVWTDGRVAFKGKAPGPLSTAEKQPDISRVWQDAKKNSERQFDPVGVYRQNGKTHVVLRSADGNTVTLAGDYYDFVNKRIPNAVFRGTDGKSSITVWKPMNVAEGTPPEMVGVIAPMRQSVESMPTGIQKLLSRKK